MVDWPEINQVAFNKEAKAIQRTKTCFPNKWFGATDHPYAE